MKCLLFSAPLGKELGSGAFGMVVQATAVGFGPQGNSQVAVKMLKGQRPPTLHAFMLSAGPTRRLVLMVRLALGSSGTWTHRLNHFK